MTRRAALLAILAAGCSSPVLLVGCSRTSTPLTAPDAEPRDAAEVREDATTPDARPPVDASGPDASGPDAELTPQSGLEVRTQSGTVRGAADGELRVFKGIPFAAAPVGARRFRAPVPVAPWSGTLPTTDYGPACPQPRLGPEFLLGDFAGPQSEDCLSLNVWAFDDARRRPVMVFIYGGGFVTGSSAWPIYDATRLARRGDVVVVTFNYRVGALGFLATETLAAESGQDSAGNYGIQDQLAALRWVRDNIVAFGGDPSNVTIFGESAGAISVCALLGAPAADGLFHRAIMESGMCTLGLERQGGPLGMPATFAGGQDLVRKVGCAGVRDELECLRALPASDLAAASSLASIFTGDVAALSSTSPHVDGVLIPRQPIERLRAGEADVPLIVGSNEDEGLLFAASAVVATRGQLRRAIASYVGDGLAEQITTLYPSDEFRLPSDAWIAFLGEVTFICPGLSAAAAASGGAPSYAYHFTRAPLISRAIGVAHGTELLYVFGTFDRVLLTPSRTDARVIESMQRAWTSFANFGAPVLSSGWPRYAPAGAQIALLDEPTSITTQIRGGRCAALQRLGVVP